MVGRGVVQPNAMEASLFESPPAQRPRCLCAYASPPRGRHHPVRQPCRPVVKIHGVQRHSAQYSIGLALCYRPIELGLSSPAALTIGDPLNGLLQRIRTPHMPTLDIGIGKRRQDGGRVSEPPRAQHHSRAHHYLRLTRSSEPSRSHGGSDQTRHVHIMAHRTARLSGFFGAGSIGRPTVRTGAVGSPRAPRDAARQPRLDGSSHGRAGDLCSVDLRRHRGGDLRRPQAPARPGDRRRSTGRGPDRHRSGYRDPQQCGVTAR